VVVVGGREQFSKLLFPGGFFNAVITLKGNNVKQLKMDFDSLIKEKSGLGNSGCNCN
jgi:hypothetical protein